MPRPRELDRANWTHAERAGHRREARGIVASTSAMQRFCRNHGIRPCGPRPRPVRRPGEKAEAAEDLPRERSRGRGANPAGPGRGPVPDNDGPRAVPWRQGAPPVCRDAGLQGQAPCPGGDPGLQRLAVRRCAREPLGRRTEGGAEPSRGRFTGRSPPACAVGGGLSPAATNGRWSWSSTRPPWHRGRLIDEVRAEQPPWSSTGCRATLRVLDDIERSRKPPPGRAARSSAWPIRSGRCDRAGGTSGRPTGGRCRWSSGVTPTPRTARDHRPLNPLVVACPGLLMGPAAPAVPDPGLLDRLEGLRLEPDGLDLAEQVLDQLQGPMNRVDLRGRLAALHAVFLGAPPVGQDDRLDGHQSGERSRGGGLTLGRRCVPGEIRGQLPPVGPPQAEDAVISPSSRRNRPAPGRALSSRWDPELAPMTGAADRRGLG